MTQKLYVGNLPYSVTNDDLKSNFGEFGTVVSARLTIDRDTGQSKGFAFVEMATDADAQAAITGLNGMSVQGRSIVVSVAKPREDRRAPTEGRSGGYRASGRQDVGYGNGGFGGGRY